MPGRGESTERLPAECHPHWSIPPKIRYSPQGVECRRCLTPILRVLVSRGRNTAGRGNLHTPLDCGGGGGAGGARAPPAHFSRGRGCLRVFFTPPSAPRGG